MSEGDSGLDKRPETDEQSVWNPLREAAEELARAEDRLALLSMRNQPADLDERIRSHADVMLAQEAVMRARRIYNDRLRRTTDSELKRIAGL